MTLTQAATITKRLIITTLVLTTLGIIGGIGYQAWRSYYLSTLPPVEEKPEMKFGTLPKPIFPDSNISSSNFSYSLDTATGGLPQTPKLLKVYFLPKAGVSLMAPEKSRKLAENLGFSSDPEILSQTEYRFNDTGTGTLDVDLTTGNFAFQRKIATDSARAVSLPDRSQAVNSFKDYLSSKGLLSDELKDGRSSVDYEKISPQDSETVEVSIWPTDVDKLPIVTSTFNRGLVKATLTKGEETINKFAKVNLTFWPVDKTTFSTYPLKTPDQAYAALRSGQGFISLEPKKPQVSISSVYLAYYESEEYSPYLQPVFVFEGPEFAALVPAIKE